MKKVITIVLLGLGLAVSIAYAAITETDDLRARPISLYGTTSGGDLVCFQVASDGTLQTS